MSSITIQRFGKAHGVARGHGQCVSFQLGADSDCVDAMVNSQRKSILSTYPDIFQLGDYHILSFGKDNQEPNRVKEIIGQNRLLPEIIEKQSRFLYGTGYYFYRYEVQDGKPVRVPVTALDMSRWLDSWREHGVADSVGIYINKAIRDFYYMEGLWTRWRLKKNRRLISGMPVEGDMPIAGLEVVSSTRCRLGSRYPVDILSYEDKDFQVVLVGDWAQPARHAMKIYPRFSYVSPLDFGVAISYSRNPSFGEEVYAYNKYFRGIEQWLIGSNLTPTYINSYYENSLSAKLHVIIPYTWVEHKKAWLNEVCNENTDRKNQGKELITVNGIEVGTDYSESILMAYIDSEIDVFTQYLSGAKNQGKAYFSYSVPGDNGESLAWKIEEVPLKYKEFITTLIDYDKRADQVLLSAKGLDASLSNITKDGVTANSGSNVYYNYMIYLATLYTAESIVLDALQHALKLSFPRWYEQGVRIGILSLNNVQRQENISVNDRMINDPT